MDNMRITPLLHAVVTGNQQVVEELLRYKANVLHVDTLRRTALEIAASQDDHAMIVLLMRHGAGALTKVANRFGKLPLEVAKREYTKEFLVAYEREYDKYLDDHPDLDQNKKNENEAAAESPPKKEDTMRFMRETKHFKKQRKSSKKKNKKKEEDNSIQAEKIPLLITQIHAAQWKLGRAAQAGDIDYLVNAVEYEEDRLHQKDQFGMTPLMFGATIL